MGTVTTLIKWLALLIVSAALWALLWLALDAVAAPDAGAGDAGSFDAGDPWQLLRRCELELDVTKRGLSGARERTETATRAILVTCPPIPACPPAPVCDCGPSWLGYAGAAAGGLGLGLLICPKGSDVAVVR